MYARGTIFSDNDNDKKYRVVGYKNGEYVIVNGTVKVTISHDNAMKSFTVHKGRVRGNETRFWARWARWLTSREKIRGFNLLTRICVIPLLFPFALLIHYSHSGMHGAFTAYMFLFNRNRYNENRKRQRQHLINSKEY